MKKFLILALFLTGCATTDSHQKACSNLCAESYEKSMLYCGESTCICNTENGIKNKAGICLLTEDPSVCTVQALLECSDKAVVRAEGGFCSNLELAIFGGVGGPG